MDQVHCLSEQSGQECKEIGSVFKHSSGDLVCGLHPFTFPEWRVGGGVLSCDVLIFPSEY